MKVNIVFFFLILAAVVCLWSCEHNPYRQGEILYVNFCAPCHGEEGEGFKDLYPPIAGADYYLNNQNNIACIIHKGLEGPIEVNGKAYDQPMAAIPRLNDIEICNIINFLNYNWNKELPKVSIDEVKRQLEGCKKGRGVLQ